MSETRLVPMERHNDPETGSAYFAYPGRSLQKLWEAGITEAEAFDGTNPSLMAERSTAFDDAAKRIRKPFQEPTS